MRYPNKVQGRISAETAAQVLEAMRRFGPSESTVVRMGLESFLPGYLAAQGRPEHVEFFTQLSTALKHCPTLKGEVAGLIRKAMRTRRQAA